RGILRGLCAWNLDPPGHPSRALRGADARGRVPPHARVDPAGRRSDGVRRARAGPPHHASNAPRRGPAGAQPDGERGRAESVDRTMSGRARLLTGTALLAVTAHASLAWAFDPEQTFKKGAYVLSAEGGYGAQFNLERTRHQSDLEFFNLGLRASILPFGTSGSGPLYGALEAGLEPFYQPYTDPKPAFWGGLAAVFRYHFLTLGRVVPYAELVGAVGGPDLGVREVASGVWCRAWSGGVA